MACLRAHVYILMCMCISVKMQLPFPHIKIRQIASSHTRKQPLTGSHVAEGLKAHQLPTHHPSLSINTSLGSWVASKQSWKGTLLSTSAGSGLEGFHLCLKWVASFCVKSSKAFVTTICGNGTGKDQNSRKAFLRYLAEEKIKACP